MNTLFLRSSVGQKAPNPYKEGVIYGPLYAKKVSGFDHTLDRLFCKPNKPDPLIESFANLGICAYLADKAFYRSNAEDNWTRRFKLSIPLDSRFSEALPLAVEGLKFLSGDIWEVEPRSEEFSIGVSKYYGDGYSPTDICLFSGGTDSLTGAINLLDSGESLLLLSHQTSPIEASKQYHLYYKLFRKYGSERVRHKSIVLYGNPSAEKSTRSRSFLFIALALMASSAFGKGIPVYIPENGFIGINVPLTPARIGSYSTRTTHPAFLYTVRTILNRLSIEHEIRNPFANYSKGAVLKSCSDVGLLKKLAPLTISCAKAGWLRFHRFSTTHNCGFCYACLIRRAAFHRIGLDKPSEYAFDAIGKPQIVKSVDQKKSNDLRSLLAAVYDFNKNGDSLFLGLLKSGSLASLEDPSTAVAVYESGMEEITNLIIDKGCREVRKFASL